MEAFGLVEVKSKKSNSHFINDKIEVGHDVFV